MLAHTLVGQQGHGAHAVTGIADGGGGPGIIFSQNHAVDVRAGAVIDGQIQSGCAVLFAEDHGAVGISETTVSVAGVGDAILGIQIGVRIAQVHAPTAVRLIEGDDPHIGAIVQQQEHFGIGFLHTVVIRIHLCNAR